MESQRMLTKPCAGTLRAQNKTFLEASTHWRLFMRRQTGESKIGRKRSSGYRSLPINIIHLRNSCSANFTPREPGYLRTTSNVRSGVVVRRNTDLLRLKHSWGNVCCPAKE